MQLLSDDDAVKWVQDLGFRVDGALPSTRILSGMAANRLRIQLPGEATAVVGLAYMLVMTDVPEYEEQNFAGALLWLQRWEIWSESIDRAGYVLLDGIRAASGRREEIASAPAHLFVRGEFAQVHACLSVPMLFQWDAHYVPASGEIFAFASHEGHVDLVSRDERVHEKLLERFQEWNPTDMASHSSAD